MDTTTTDGGAAEATQPEPTAAVIEQGDQVISNDENGTPILASPAQSSADDEAVTEETSTEATTETQAPADDIESWAEKKGIDLKKADPVKLAQMVRESEKRMHEATVKARELETTSVAQAPLEYSGDPNIDSLTAQVNTLLIKNNVNDFFNSNPQAREHESKMAEIVTARPHLQNDLDALYALARTDPSREADLKQAGGREALTNLAQKQSQIPPTANATNGGVFEGQTITASNVYDLVDNNDQAWFEKNHSLISKAMSGK